MSCYILPAGSSTFVNFATVYPSSVIIGGSTWPTAPATGGIKLPAVTGLGTSAGPDHLTAAPTAITLVTPEVASSFLYQSLCHGTTPGSVQTSASSLPVATPSSSFCCVAPYSTAVAASGNFPFSVEPFPETGGNVGKAVYTCNGMSTFRLVSSDVLSLSQSSKSSIACSEPSGWRSPTGVALGGGSPQEFYRLRRLLRRVRRRVGAGSTSQRGGIAAGDDEKEEECGSESAGGKYPLYCVVCRVKLNATAQAKQHYTGRSHARRVRLLYGPAVVNAAGTAADPALQSATDVPPGGSTANDSSSMISTTSTTTSDDNHMDDVDHHQVALVSSSVNQTHRPMFPAGTVSPVSCDVYCSACAVSFNSTTQARQHYHGKSHAKRLRTLHPELYASLSLCTASRTTTEGATAHKESSYVCFICNSCPGSHGQHVRISTSQLHSVNSGNNRSLKHCAASVSGINGRRRSIRAPPLRHDRK